MPSPWMGNSTRSSGCAIASSKSFPIGPYFVCEWWAEHVGMALHMIYQTGCVACTSVHSQAETPSQNLRKHTIPVDKTRISHR